MTKAKANAVIADTSRAEIPKSAEGILHRDHRNGQDFSGECFRTIALERGAFKNFGSDGG